MRASGLAMDTIQAITPNTLMLKATGKYVNLILAPAKNTVKAGNRTTIQ